MYCDSLTLVMLGAPLASLLLICGPGPMLFCPYTNGNRESAQLTRKQPLARCLNDGSEQRVARRRGKGWTMAAYFLCLRPSSCRKGW